MNTVLTFLRDFSFASIIIRLLCSALAGGIIGVERGRHGRIAGMRTHILVCMGAAMTSLIGVFVVEVIEIGMDASRIAAQTISGIGFLGVGTILIKGRSNVIGLTTAAGLWACAAIGLAFGYGFFEGAIIALLISILANTILPKIEHRFKLNNVYVTVYVEIESVGSVQDTLSFLKNKFPIIETEVVPPKSGLPGNVGIETVLYTKETHRQIEDIIDEISRYEKTLFATRGY